MYAQVIGAQLQPRKTDDACRIYRETILPPLKALSGYAASFLLTDLDIGKVLLVIVWQSEMDVTSQFTSGRQQEQIAQFGDVLASPAQVEVFELTSTDSLVRLAAVGNVGFEGDY